MSTGEPLTAPCTHHGEGPVWDDRGQRLLVVDMLAGSVLDLADPDTPRRHRIGTVAAALRPRRGGGFVAATEHGFLELDDALAPRGAEVTALHDPTVRMNDGGCDPQGRFYCGTMAYDSRPGAGTLFQLDTDQQVRSVLTGVTISNGLQWSGDGARVFYNDTATGRVDVFDHDPGTGELRDRRPFATIEPPGAPDGMAIDAEDGIWVALWGGSRVVRLDGGGRVSEVVELPVRQVSACTFGGADLQTLFITTSRDGLGAEAEDAAGAVFAVRPGVTGVLPLPYGRP